MIFGKREPVATGRTEPDASSVTPALREKISQVQERRIQHSILSADLQITGDVISSGDITIEGAVDGNIECRCLTLAGQPEVKGCANAQTVLVSGTFTGDIRARKVILTKTANLVGDIYNETLEIQPGASFEGKVHRLESKGDAHMLAKQPKADGEKAADGPSPNARSAAKTAA